MSSEQSSGGLSQFGQDCVRQIAEEKARVVDERNDYWRYHLEGLLALMIPLSAIGVVGSLLLVAYTQSVGEASSPGFRPLAINTALLAVSYYLRPRVANPDINV